MLANKMVMEFLLPDTILEENNFLVKTNRLKGAGFSPAPFVIKTYKCGMNLPEKQKISIKPITVTELKLRQII